jgi:Tfp pilus assembly protein PilV
MYAVRLAAGLITVALLAAASAKADDPEPVTTPFFRMTQGQTVTCSVPEGCVAITSRAYEMLLRAVEEKGAERACRSRMSL